VREVREWRGVRQSTGVSLFSSGAVGFSSQKTIYYSQKKTIYNARCEEVRHRGGESECSVGAGVGKWAEKERMV
jgi:hypothetical protein